MCSVTIALSLAANILEQWLMPKDALTLYLQHSWRTCTCCRNQQLVLLLDHTASTQPLVKDVAKDATLHVQAYEELHQWQQ